MAIKQNKCLNLVEIYQKMAIKFKVIERGEPGVVGGGTKKFYASPVMDGEMNLNDLNIYEKKCMDPRQSKAAKVG